MAPDLNSVPVSPRQTTSTTGNTQTNSNQPRPSNSRQNSTTTSRRASQIYPMSPPPLPLASPGGTIPSHHSAQHTTAFPPLSPSLSSSAAAGYADAASAPMRHPRPMTAAEMHLELEKEQEAVVNRLTRELSALRAHSASVASTASISSSTASGALLDADGNHTTAGMLSSSSTSGIFPTSGRRHRSSSSVSRSAILTPSSSYPHRYSISSQSATGANTNAGAGATSDPSSMSHRDREHRSSSIVSTPRYEEVAMQKAELEEVKRENEVLKERIRELERKIKGREGLGNGAGGVSGSGEERGRTGRGEVDGGAS